MNERIQLDSIELRRLREEDVEAFVAAVRRNYQHLRPAMSFGRYAFDEQFARRFFAEKVRAWSNSSEYAYGIWLAEELIGSISLHSLQLHPGQADFAYWIDQAHEGRGFITTATRALIEEAFTSLPIDVLEIACRVHNQRSRRVAERLGFTEQARRRVIFALPGLSFEEARYTLKRP